MPPNTPDDTSTLERLRQKLYAPQAPESFPAPTLSHTTPVSQVGEGWVPPAPPVIKKKKRVSYAALFLGIAILFFVGAIAAASYFLVFGSRSVSSDHIDIQVDGPTSISSGDTVTLLISIENKNPVLAQNTELSLTFPDTARVPDAPEETLKAYEDTVGDIEPGATTERSVPVVLYGSENERILIPIRFEYRIEGSNATFVKEAEYEVTITSSPISIRAEAVSEASAGQPLTFAVTVRSNAEEPLENVAVLAQYPFGFQAKRGEGPVFPIGTLAPGEEKTVAVSGTITGENNDERVFRFTAGIRRGEDTNTLLVSYSTAETAVLLTKPFLSTTLSVNRDTSISPVIEAGTQVQNVLSWINTLPNPILDGQIVVKLAGTALDTSSINAFNGFYRSSDGTITFSKETAGGLSRLAPGDTGSGTFNFNVKTASQLAGQKNPTVTATISVAGRRVDESNVPESITSSVVRTIQVSTDLVLTGRSLYSTGAFRNTGPWPPVADQETTYTIDLALTNSVNSVADAIVTGTLPSYVRFVAASDNAITYNAATRTVTWRAGELAPAGSRSGAFQVALLPSASQRGTSPILMTGIKGSGVDRFTQKQLSLSQYDITTQTDTDPAYVQGKAEVK